MYGIQNTLLKTLLLLLRSFATTALQCLECQDMPSPEDCRIVTTCSSNSQCYVEQVVTSGGSILYNSGCLSTTRCEHSGRKRQATVSGSDIVTCVNCCKDDFCNLGGCGVVATKQPQRPPVCFSCPSQVDPSSCRDVTLCEEQHMCALIETVMYNSHQWKSECAPKLQCQILGNRSVTVAGDLCYTCCQDDFCNNNCNQQITKTTTLLTTASSPSPSVTVLTPTQYTTSTLTAIVSNVNPSKQTHTIAFTTIKASTVNKSTTSSHISTQISTVTSITTAHSNATTEINPSATSAHTYPSSTLSGTPASTLNNINTSQGTLLLKTSSTSTGSTTSALSTGTVSTRPTTETSGALNTTLTPKITNRCINQTFDICFVIDSSGSLGQSGFDKELHFVNEVVKDIARETNSTTHFCVVRFSTDAVLAVKLRQFDNVDNIINFVETIPYSNGETHTHVGLQKAVHELRYNGRHGVEKDIILITDGKSNFPDKTLNVVHHMESLGISLYAVGIGTQTDSSELQTFVTDNNHLLQVPDTDHLDNLYVNIVQTLCERTSI